MQRGSNLVYSIRHITSFAYEPAIRESVMEVRVQPRNEAQQSCLTFSLDINPDANIMSYRDYLGNTIHHFDIPGRHTQFKVTAQALVDVRAASIPAASDVGTWKDLDSTVGNGDYWEMLLPSHFAHSTELLDALAAELHVERRGNPLETLLELNGAIYRAFDYVPNITKVDSPIDDALRDRKGVCQDLSHIMIALVRQLGIPCRYVSGYLCQRDLCQGQNTRDRSADGATHAWLEAFLPGPGWVAFDPTNDLVGGQRHIRVAIGRDYADVPPTRGVYKGDAESELSVAVLVAPAEAPSPEEIAPITVIRTKAPNRSGFDHYQFEQQQQQQ
jgi:transglutaminase-like putative cysteine protease